MARDSDGYESLQDISMLSSTVTTKEHLQLCCKPTYKPRRVKNKGAVFCTNLELSGYECVLFSKSVSNT